MKARALCTTGLMILSERYLCPFVNSYPLSVRACVRVCARVCVCVCARACVCVCERERERVSVYARARVAVRACVQ